MVVEGITLNQQVTLIKLGFREIQESKTIEMFSYRKGVVSSLPEESHVSSNLHVNGFNDEKIHCSHNADSGSSPIKYEPFSEMVMWLRRIAIDPCNKKASSESQCRRALKVRKVLFLNSTELPWKKRKYHQLLNESPTAATDSLQKLNEQCVTGLSIGQRSLTGSISCLINCTDSADSSEPVLLKKTSLNGETMHGDNLSRKRVLHEHFCQADAMDWNMSLTKELPILICSDDSCSGSNPPSPRRPVLQMLDTSMEILESGDDLSMENVDISSNYQADLGDRSSPTKKQSPWFDSDDSVISSDQSTPMKPKANRISRRLSRLMKLTNDSSSIIPIPIGPRFQADVPDWTCSMTNADDSNSRWLGTRVWPVEGRETESNNVLIGKGRPSSCSCEDLGTRVWPVEGMETESNNVLIGKGRLSSCSCEDLGTRVWPVEGMETESNNVLIGKRRPSSCSCEDLGTRVWPVEGMETESNNGLIGKGRPCSCCCEDLGSTNCIRRHLIEKRLQLRAELGPAYFQWRFNEMGEEVSRAWTKKEQNTFDILVKTNPVSKNKSFLKSALKYFRCKCRESIVSYYFNVAVLRRMSRRTRSDPGSADSDDDEADGSAGYSKSVRTRYLIRHR